MADEISIPPENVSENNVAPNIDAELDAALNKSFASMRVEATDKTQTSDEKNQSNSKDELAEEKSNSESPKKDIKSEEIKKVDKAIESEKPLITPDQIEKMDPKKQDGWNAIRNSNKRAHGMIEQRDAEIAKLKAAIAEKSSASQKELEAIKAEKLELEKYRAMVDIQADPEFVSKYDQPLDKAKESVKEMLLKLNVSQETINGLNFKNTELLDQVIAIVAQKDRFTASKLERKFKDVLELSDLRDETLSQQQKNFKETLEKKKQENYAKGAESEGRMIKHLELKATEKDKDGNPLISFLNKIEPKENATQAEIDQINNHNGLVDMMGKKLHEVMKMREPEQQAEIAIAAVASHYLMAQNRALNQELKKAREELQKISVVSSETPSRKPVNVQRNGTNDLVDSSTALDNFFSRSR